MISNLNALFFELLSLPFAVFLTISVINIVISFYILLFYINNSILLLFPILTTLYLLYLTNINNQIQQLVFRICQQLNVLYKNKNAKQKQLKNNFSVSNHKLHQQIIYYETECYFKAFQIKLFNSIQINRSFILNTILVIVNYMIFIYQTK